MLLQSLSLTLPELILSTAALILMLAAAWGGDRSARLITWLAIAAFVAAARFIPGDPGGRALGCHGLCVSARFATFSKVGI